jgi:DNA-binding response OmpR family regulator
MRVLVVDDHTEIVEVLAKALHSRGLEAVKATTAAEAKDVIDADDPTARHLRLRPGE